MIHGLSDGSWSLSDGIRELLRIVGPSRTCVVSTWTACKSRPSGKASRLLQWQAILSLASAALTDHSRRGNRTIASWPGNSSAFDCDPGLVVPRRNSPCPPRREILTCSI